MHELRRGDSHNALPGDYRPARLMGAEPKDRGLFAHIDWLHHYLTNQTGADLSGWFAIDQAKAGQGKQVFAAHWRGLSRQRCRTGTVVPSKIPRSARTPRTAGYSNNAGLRRRGRGQPSGQTTYRTQGSAEEPSNRVRPQYLDGIWLRPHLAQRSVPTLRLRCCHRRNGRGASHRGYDCP